MTHAYEAVPHPSSHEEDAIVGGAWLGPAIGSAILTIAWALYLAPVLIGIFSTG